MELADVPDSKSGCSLPFLFRSQLLTAPLVSRCKARRASGVKLGVLLLACAARPACTRSSPGGAMAAKKKKEKKTRDTSGLNRADVFALLAVEGPTSVASKYGTTISSSVMRAVMEQLNSLGSPLYLELQSLGIRVGTGVRGPGGGRGLGIGEAAARKVRWSPRNPKEKGGDKVPVLQVSLEPYREAWGLEETDSLLVSLEEDQVVIRPITPDE